MRKDLFISYKIPQKGSKTSAQRRPWTTVRIRKGRRGEGAEGELGSKAKKERGSNLVAALCSEV